MPGHKPAGNLDRFIWREGDAEMKVIRMQCWRCRHFMGGLHPACHAFQFPKTIPSPIYFNEVDHRQPYEGDRGIRWEPREPGVRHPFDEPADDA